MELDIGEVSNLNILVIYWFIVLIEVSYKVIVERWLKYFYIKNFYYLYSLRLVLINKFFLMGWRKWIEVYWFFFLNILKYLIFDVNVVNKIL